MYAVRTYFYIMSFQTIKETSFVIKEFKVSVVVQTAPPYMGNFLITCDGFQHFVTEVMHLWIIFFAITITWLFGGLHLAFGKLWLAIFFAIFDAFTVSNFILHIVGIGLGYDMLCYVMSCYVMLCYVMSCRAMLCHAMPCHAMPCHAMPNHTKPNHTIPYHICYMVYGI